MKTKKIKCSVVVIAVVVIGTLSTAGLGICPMPQGKKNLVVFYAGGGYSTPMLANVTINQTSVINQENGGAWTASNTPGVLTFTGKNAQQGKFNPKSFTIFNSHTDTNTYNLVYITPKKSNCSTGGGMHALFNSEFFALDVFYSMKYPHCFLQPSKPTSCEQLTSYSYTHSDGRIRPITLYYSVMKMRISKSINQQTSPRPDKKS